MNQIRKVTKTKGSFTSQTALEKLIYLVIKNCAEKLCNYIDNIDSSSLVNSETDHWLNKAGKELDLVVYWAEPTIVLQGSQNDPNDSTCY